MGTPRNAKKIIKCGFIFTWFYDVKGKATPRGQKGAGGEALEPDKKLGDGRTHFFDKKSMLPIIKPAGGIVLTFRPRAGFARDIIIQACIK